MDMLITPEDITEILQKRYKERNNCDSLDNLTKVDIDNFIIESEISKFSELFNGVFEDELLPLEYGDSEDGVVNNITLKIIESIKESLEKVNKEKLLKILFKLLSKMIFEDSDN